MGRSREIQLKFMVNESEKRMLDELAGLDGEGVSTYLRRLIKREHARLSSRATATAQAHAQLLAGTKPDKPPEGAQRLRQALDGTSSTRSVSRLRRRP